MLIIIFNIKEILLAKLTEAPQMWCPKKLNMYAFKSEGIIFPKNCPFSVRTAFFPHALGNLNHVSFLLRYKSIEYPSVSVSLYWLLSVYCEVLCCRFFFCSDSARFHFLPLFLALQQPLFLFYRMARTPLAVLSFRPLGSTGIALRRPAFTSHLLHSGLN